MKRSLPIAAFIGAIAGSLIAQPAHACGCFTPPDPSVPIVQAGERIVFAVANSQVEAHIQIQYAGDAQDFGWLLPLPSLPTLELGTDELFTQLINQTQPKYRLNVGKSCSSNSVQFGGAGAASPSAAEDKNAGGGSALVIQDSIGPYDYAVLKADSKADMLSWLNANHYFVPAGTDSVVGPYIHTGAYFLALRLHSGKSAGDLQPVVVRYTSDLPMIPIVLTSTAAKPDMGIQVWMLGKGRAIPRNYFHTVINEAAIDWVRSGANYNDLIIRATKEAKERHTFVTEFAGASSVMKGLLDRQGRFGSKDELKQIFDAATYVAYLQNHGFNQVTSAQGGFGGGPQFQQVLFSSVLLSILQAYIPMPPALLAQKVTPAQYYGQIQYYLTSYRQQNPDQFKGLNFNYDPIKLTDEIWKRVVGPTTAAAQLFTTFSYLTRLYTTLSPENMNSDPVFSFNPDLPDVSNVHQATQDFNCNWLGKQESATISTDSGFVIQLPDGTTPSVQLTSLPASLRIEVLREQGNPEVQTDNGTSIKNALGQGGGCSVTAGGSKAGNGWLVLAALAALVGVRRRRHAS